jgi:uncharacterized membrane protein required for colicin V production
MGLDIALGVMVLVAAIRGWFKGFVLQAIHIAALVGCVYLADPLRDLARPYVRDYFPGVQPELLDRLMWWTGAVAAYLVTAGVAVSTVRLYRRRHYLEGLEPNRGDQGAGFLLGAAKGGLVVIFLAAGIGRHVPSYIQSGGWIAQQIERSWSIKLTHQYHPAEQVWNSVPVQTLVTRIRQRGLWEKPAAPAQPSETAPPAQAERSRPEAPVPAALPSKTLAVPPPRLDPRSPTFLDDVDRAITRELGESSRR